MYTNSSFIPEFYNIIGVIFESTLLTMTY